MRLSLNDRVEWTGVGDGGNSPDLMVGHAEEERPIPSVWSHLCSTRCDGRGKADDRTFGW
jgi:hypothetical protein